MPDIIKVYETYYEKRGENQQESSESKPYERKNSIIDHIKFIVDEKELIKSIERGFLNCKFVREEINIENQKIAQTTKLNRQQYLLQ